MSDGPRLRDQQAQLTRRAILSAARSLFGEHGYAQTSMRMLADGAGVAVQTIYSTFKSKAGVLMGLVDAIDADEVEPIARRLAQCEDPGEALDLVARLQRHVRERGGDVIKLLRQGMATEPDVGQVFEAGFSRHRRGVELTCARLAERGDLRPGLTLEDAIATTLAVTSLEAYEELIDRRRWRYDDYERWMSETLRTALLPPAIQ